MKIVKKGALFALFFHFFSCSHDSREWSLTSNRGSSVDYCSSRLFLRAENQFSDLEIEFLSTAYGDWAYLNSCGMALEPEESSPDGKSLVTIHINIENQSQTFSGFLLQGGHRILFPDAACHTIIQALLENRAVEISVGRLTTVIIPDQFALHYKKLK